jgi:hypothetical protein
MKLLKEPLIHFLLIGAALFTLYAALDRRAPTSPDEVVVSAGQIENLTANFTKVWQRPPSANELKGLIDAYVKEEVLSREAIKLGLDRDDPVIRRRLQQKMEFFAEDFAALAAPTDAELAAYLARHPEKFQQDGRMTIVRSSSGVRGSTSAGVMVGASCRAVNKPAGSR